MALDRLGARSEAVARKEARQQPVHGGLARVQRLAHRAVDHLHARRLGRAGTDRRERLLRRQAEQPRGRHGRADVADGAGDVPADVVVSRPRGDRDPGLHLEARDERLDRGHAGDRDQFAGRGDGRPQRRAAVDRGAVGVERVVEVQHVRGDPVGQRRVARARALRGCRRSARCANRHRRPARRCPRGPGRPRRWPNRRSCSRASRRGNARPGARRPREDRRFAAGREAGQRGAYRLLIGHRHSRPISL